MKRKQIFSKNYKPLKLLKIKINEGVLYSIIDKKYFSDALDKQTLFLKIQKLRNDLLKILNHELKGECSSELIVKTKNIQMHYISKQHSSKTSKYPK